MDCVIDYASNRSHKNCFRNNCVIISGTMAIGVETEGLVDYQGKVEIHPIVRWNLRPVIFGVILCAVLCSQKILAKFSEKRSVSQKKANRLK